MHAYLRGEIPFGAIARTVRHALDTVPAAGEDYTLEEILEADRQARAAARAYLSRKE